MELLTIGEIARRAGVCKATLHQYEKLGIIAPARDSSDRRLYTTADVDAVRAAYAERMARRPHLNRRPMAA